MLDGDPMDVQISEIVIRCAIAAHEELGPGLLESVYETALSIELTMAGIPFNRQIGIPVTYKGHLIAEHRPDLIVNERVVVDVKCVERLNAVHVAQVLTYLRITDLHVGLLLNFSSAFLKQGIRRVIR